VAIYLDANILWSWRTFAEVDRLALSIVADQVGQRIYIPQVAAREAEETYRRSLQDAVDAHESALAELRRKFNEEIDARLEPEPWPDDAVSAWLERMSDLAEVIPLEAEDAVASLEREIIGRPPTKQRVPNRPGAGARDAAIWLTVLRHHRDAGEEGHLISRNPKDFAGADGILRSELEAELVGLEHSLYLYTEIGQFLATLGTPSPGPEIVLSELQRLAEPMLKEALRDAPDIPPVVWGRQEEQLRYGTVVTEAKPVSISRQLRYEREDEAVTLVDARWELVVEARFQDANTDAPDRWRAIEDVGVSGDVQLYIPERGAESARPQLITARWRTDTSLYMRESGDVMSITIG
jgi:hypothetical protein